MGSIVRNWLALSFAIVGASEIFGQRPADADWPIAAKDGSGQRYSQLDQITTENVATLRAAWTFHTGVFRGQEAAPIVIGSTMYVITPFPNILYALDLAQAGKVKWKYEPAPVPMARGVACCDYVSRGAAFGDGKIFINTLDGRTIALDAESGREGLEPSARRYQRR